MKKKLACLVLSCAIVVPLGAVQAKPSMESFLKEGREYTARGEYRKAVFSLSEALSRAQRREERGTVAVVLRELGAAHAASGEYRRAVSCYKDALKISRQHSRVTTGKICAGLGEVYFRLGAPLRAVGYYSDALRLLESTATRREKYAMTLNLGRAYAGLGEYGKALSSGSRALKLARALGKPELAAPALSLLGRAETGLGRDESAGKRFGDAAKIYAASNDLRSLKDDAAFMSAEYASRGDVERAASCYDETQAYAEKAGDAQILLECFKERGRIFEKARDNGKALYYYGEAAKTGIAGDDSGLHVADLRVLSGERAAAEEQYIFLGDPVRLGFMELGKRNYRKAGELFGRALAGGENTDGGALFAARTGLGEAYEGLGDPGQAERYFASAVSQLDTIASVTGGAIELPPYPPGLSLLSPLERLVGLRVARGSIAEGFYASEQAKSLLYKEDAERRGNKREARALPPELEREEKVTVSRLSVLDKEIKALSRAMMVEDLEGVQKEYAAVKERFARMISKVRKYDPDYAALAYPAPISYDAVRLEPNEVLLEFEVTADRTYLFIMDGKERALTVRTIPLGRAELARLTHEYTASWKNESYDEGRGKRLFKTIFDRELDRFAGGTTLVIVSDEDIASLPLASLPAGKSANRKKTARYLGDAYNMVYAPSARLFSDRKGGAR